MLDVEYGLPYWKEGHNSGSSFWIMPVRQGKDSNDGDWGCFCCPKEEISIDDEIVNDYLYKQYLKKYFDENIKYTCRYCNPGEKPEFDWNGYNLYTYDSIRKMALEMKSDFNSAEKKESAFYNSLADRLLLMIEREPDWDFITFEGP